MKRTFVLILILAVCFTAVSAFADSEVNVNVDTGNHSPVSINVNSIDGCNNGASIGGPAGRPGNCGQSYVIINGVPSCIEPPNHCGPDPDYCARMRRHSCLKNAARDVVGYLEGQLRDIGWWHKSYKFIWSFETRVIYGSCGDNHHYGDRRPITFYCVDDPSIKVTAYISVYKHAKEYYTLFSTDFTPAAKCSSKPYTYREEQMITGAYVDGYEAVDEFIRYLRSLSGDTNGCNVPAGCNCGCNNK